MKTKLLICAVLLLGAVGITTASNYVKSNNNTHIVADRFGS